MPTMKLSEDPPGGDAPYGTVLAYWMAQMGVSDQDMARKVGIDRTYPGHIKRGIRLPSTPKADKIRAYLHERAQEPGWNAGPRLTELDRRKMDADLQTSFDRENRARQRVKPPAAQPVVAARQPNEGQPLDAPNEGQLPAAEDEPPMPAAQVLRGVTPVAQAPAPPHRRASSTRPITGCLLILGIALSLASLIYYLTHPSSLFLLKQPLAAQPSAAQLYGTVTAARAVLADPLTGPSANGWDEGAQHNGLCAYSGGAYHSTVLYSAVIQCLPGKMPPLPSAGTFAVQVDMALLAGDGGGGLVLYYAGPTTRYYRFLVTRDGHFDLYDPLTGSHTSGTTAVPAARYRLTAIARATSMYLYINGVLVAQPTMDPGVTVAGKIGVFSVDGVHNPTDVAFHNFTVWSLS